MNKSVFLGAKINARSKMIAKLDEELEGLKQRAEESVNAIDDVESDEDLSALEAQVDELQAQIEEKEAEKKEIEEEIKQLQEQIDALNEKKPAEGNERKMTTEIETRTAFNQFVKSKGMTRDGVKIVDGGALVPIETLKPQEKPEVAVDLTTIVNTVKVNSKSGQYAVVKKSGRKMVSVAELEKNPELGKFSVEKVTYDIKTYRGNLAVSQEMIDDAEFDVMGYIGADTKAQELATQNAAICDILKTATAKVAKGFDGLKDVINKDIKSVYNVTLVVTDSMFAALDKVKDATGRYMLQPDVTSPTGYKFAGKVIYRVPDELLGAAGEMKAFVGEPKAFVTLFDRTQTTVKWVANEIYGEVLGTFARFDVKKTDSDAGVFVTYADADKK